MKENKISLAPIENNGIVKVGNSIEITEKLLLEYKQRIGDNHTKRVQRFNKVRWKYRLNDIAGWLTAPIICNGTIYCGSASSAPGENSGYLYALDSKTGNEIWKFKKLRIINEWAWMQTSPAIANGIVYCGSYNGWLYALDSKTGKELWECYINGKLKSPLVSEEIVYCSSDKGLLYAVKCKTGSPLWKFKIEQWIGRPSVVDGSICFSTGENNLFLIDNETGKILWKHNEGSIGTPVSFDGKIYCGNFNNYFYCLDSKTGKEIWRFKSEGRLNPPVIANGIVFCSNHKGVINALEYKTGNELWKIETGELIINSPSISDGVLYFGSSVYGGMSGFKLNALEYKTGVHISDFIVDGMPKSVVIENGVLYCSTSKGSLYAIE